MNNVIRKVILVIIVVSFTLNLGEAQIMEDGDYFSSKLTEGSVLRWENTYSELEPEEIVFPPQNITITILQEIPEEPIHQFNMQDYFYITYNEVNTTIIFMLHEHIVPNLYVINGEIYEIYEHIVNTYEESEYSEVDHSAGNTILVTTVSRDDSEWTMTTTIDDETGIVRKRTQHLVYFEDDEISSESISETVYVSGIDLTSVETSVVIVVLIGVPIFYLINKRRKKKSKFNLP